MDTQPPILQPLEIEPIQIVKPAETFPPQPTIYKIVYGDTLEKIAKAHGTTVERLYNKNIFIANPDHIEPDMQMVIPNADEVLQDRPDYVVEEIVEPVKQVNKPVKNVSLHSGYNTYTPGQCTWGVKNWRPSIPNGWGNASEWVGNARAQGWSTGSTPRVGAVGASGNHVVLVIAVKGDTVTIKEMNYNWTPYAVRTIDRPASKFTYIY